MIPAPALEVLHQDGRDVCRTGDEIVGERRGERGQMSDKDKLAETAEFYDTHDTSAEMQAGEWSRHEGKQPETAMSGFNTRLPTHRGPNDARAVARARGMDTRGHRGGRRTAERGTDMVPMSVLLAAAADTSTAGPLDQLTGR